MHIMFCNIGKTLIFFKKIYLTIWRFSEYLMKNRPMGGGIGLKVSRCKFRLPDLYFTLNAQNFQRGDDEMILHRLIDEQTTKTSCLIHMTRSLTFRFFV